MYIGHKAAFACHAVDITLRCKGLDGFIHSHPADHKRVAQLCLGGNLVTRPQVSSFYLIEYGIFYLYILRLA